jgi:hypothetical protein
MATIVNAVNQLEPEASRKECIVVVWEALANGDTGDPIRYAEYADRSVQITGDFGGGTLTMQGSNDVTSPSNWFTLTDTLENNISKTGAAAEQILQASVWIRPSLSGGAAGDVDVKLLLRRGRGRTL